MSAEAVADDVEAVDVSSGVDQEVDEQRHLLADCLDVRHRAEVQRGLAESAPVYCDYVDIVD